MTLDELGSRICIMGPSNSGKSTLANAIGRARGIPPVHLDQLRHLPNTAYEMRPEDEFIALHDEAIAAPKWVMDGNYSICLPQRLERATGLILLEIPVVAGLLRYLRRCRQRNGRHGALEGGNDDVRWEMIHHIMTVGRVNRHRHRKTFEAASLPKLLLKSPKELDNFYRSAGLSR